MSLAPGTKLGPYEIVGPLGAGGMGEVYRARDTRLGRDVAVKILPSHLSQNAEVRERFEREARAISSLNHPHICTLYDVGREGEAEYFVMELLDGESLAKRLERGAMKPDEALRVAGEIADGLAAAHRQGIVHRDLKPGNVVLTKAGAKILDFGVAKLREEQVVDMATRTTPLTSHGAMVGTVQYMAPEQLEGKPVDHRADLFAFGALLYEMVTGHRAFAGQSQASVIAAILTSEPRAVSELAPASPAALDRIVKLCLAKDPDERWQSAGDLGRELRWIADGKSSVAPQAIAAAPASGTTWRERAAWALAAVLLVATLVLLKRPKPEALHVETTRFSVNPLDGRVDGAPVVSPDGRYIVYALSPDSGMPALWLHALETGTAKLLPGTEGARMPFWSPDGKSIAFFAQGKLKKTTLAGDPPIRLCDAADPRGGVWGPSGDILFCPSAASAIFRVAATGGTPAALTHTGGGEQSQRFPEALPDGRHFLFTTIGGVESVGVYWASIDSPDRKRILPDVTSAKYDERGYLVFRRGGSLLAQPFDPAKGTLSGEPAVLAADVGTDTQITSFDQFSISKRGVLAVRTGASQQLKLTWLDRTGKTLGEVAPSLSLAEPALSPDETKLATGGGSSTESGSGVWIVDLKPGGQASRLTFGKQDAETATWSADGRFVQFTLPGQGGWSIQRKAADGTGAEETLVESKNPTWCDGASPDGKFLLLESYTQETGSDLWLLPLEGKRDKVVYRQTPSNETHAAISPDSRYVAYSSDEQGVSDVFIETLPTSGSRWQVSSGGGDQPQWRADGKALYYVTGNRMLMEVPVTSTTPLKLGTPAPLFRLGIPGITLTGPRSYVAPTRNGERFMVDMLVGDRGAPGFQVVLNWGGAGGATKK